MTQRTIRVGIAGMLGAALLAAGCSDAAGPDRIGLGAPLFAVAQVDAAIDQQGGSLGERGFQFRKGFDVANPHLGSAVVATFFWYGSGHITSVSDNLSNGIPVGNTYRLVDSVRAGNISMATYVALDVQNFPPLYHDENCNDGGCYDSILVVRGTFSDSVAGGIMISAFMGVDSVAAFRSASGSGSTAPTPASVGGIPVNAGALVYGVTMADAVVDPVRPSGAGYNMVYTMTESEAPMWADAEYAVQASAGSADPQWLWAFSRPSTWLATALALNQVNRPPSVNAGADEKAVSGLFYTLNATFGDPDNNGPWSYRIEWGDGSTTTGTAASQGSISAGHNYVSPLPSSYTIRVTVTDGRGASGLDTKVFTVGL